MALRVVFADDNYLVREGVTSLLNEADSIEVVAAARDLDSLIRSVAENSPAGASLGPREGLRYNLPPGAH